MTETTTVLLVDDDAFNREGVRLFLRREHCEVREAGDAQWRWRRSAAETIHVAVIDISIPPDPATPSVRASAVLRHRSGAPPQTSQADVGCGALLRV